MSGTQLVAAVEDWAYSVGATILKLSVVENNYPARKLYSRKGFVDVGLKSGDMEVGCERVMLKKKP